MCGEQLIESVARDGAVERDDAAHCDVPRAAAFANSIGEAGVGQYSCNCILNYLYGDLEGKKTGGFTGPVTFGEIAYILLNQTLVKLDVKAA